MYKKITLLLMSLCLAATMSAVEVLLNFYADGHKIHTETVNSGTTYTLSSIVSNGDVTTCRGYTFVGWKRGSAVEADETPTVITSITMPEANVNLYAVYSKTADVNRYIRVTSLADLQAGAKYLIVCYYYYGRYYSYAMSNRTYNYNGLVVATSVSPSDGVINNPAEALVWTLSGGTGAWVWKNESVNQYLYIRGTNRKLLDDSEHTCSISVNSGDFDFVSGDNHLSYNTSYNYFTTANSDNFTIQLYRKDESYTSYPDCSKWEAHLDAVEGLVDGNRIKDIEEPSAGTAYTLPSATSPCTGWNFYGWHVDSPVETTTTAPTVKTGAYSFDYDGVTLYAVYRKTSGGTQYSSYPHCQNYTAVFHACGGRITVDDIQYERYEITEPSVGTAITLPTAEPLEGCSEGWEFIGWSEGEDKGAQQDVDCPFTLVSSPYYIRKNQINLYAIYRRRTDRYRIINSLPELFSGDNYLITFYARENGSEELYDWELSSETSDGNLRGIKGVAPQNGSGYYMVATDPNVIWYVTGSGNSWTIRNTGNNQYLKLGNGTTSTTVSGNTINIVSRDELAVQIYSGSNYLYYNSEDAVYKTRNRYYSDGGYWPICYMYRQEKEYTSWPHCDPFTVNFDGCGGNAGSTSLQEQPAAYAGVELPDGYANTDCAKEGWTFAGWATSPISEETDVLSLNLLPAGVLYHPTKNNTTLYAVYYKKTNRFQRINSMSDLRTGVNYIIARNGTNAMGSTRYDNPDYIASTEVSPSANVITTDDHAIEWMLLGEPGEYVWRNTSHNSPLYLDLSTPGKALLSVANAEDNFMITCSSPSFTIRSNMNLSSTQDGAKFLGFNSSYFNTVASNNTPTIYLYQQQATYHSYPSCVDPVDALKWTADNKVIVESYSLTGVPDLNGAVGLPVLQDDGTYLITYNPSVIPAGTKTGIAWETTTGGGTITENAALIVPYNVTTGNVNASTLGAADCSACDYVIQSGDTLTIDANKTVHTLTIYDGGTLVVAANKTLTVNSLVLFSEGDAFSTPNSGQTVTVASGGNIVLKNGELYHDRRIDENRYYWLTLPYDAPLKAISYSNLESNGKTPVYRTDFWVKHYDGARRAADVNGGELAKTYWTHVAAPDGDYVLQAGQGYEIGIADQAKVKQEDNRYHTKRVLRFTMKPQTSSWISQEQNSTKVATVAPSSANDSHNAPHAGWNLIGNPYMHEYTTGAASGLRNGAWVKEEDENNDWYGFYVPDETKPKNVPYFTIYNPAAEKGKRYSQVQASEHTLRPMEAVFVQIEEGSQINFANPASVSGMPAYRRAQELNVPVRTGILLAGNGLMDKTGFVLSEEYSSTYEIGADLLKAENTNAMNLYSLNADNQLLAFNGLSEEDAIDPIPLGVSFPSAGEYTFAFNVEQYSFNAIDTLMIIDYTTGETQNLKYGNYTFTTDAGTVNNRFAILIRLASQSEIVTDMEEIYDPTKPRKIIRDNHLYILHDDDMYNANGAKVK